MKILIIFAHPGTSSYTRSLLDRMDDGLLDAGHEVKVKDLYAEGFDPILRELDLSQLQTGNTPTRILKEQQDVLWADALVFIYPLWWYSPPAMLKGWFDCVFSYGFAFERKAEKGISGLLTHKKALVLITAGNSEDWFKQRNAEEIIYRPMTEGTLNFCGINDVDCHVLFNTSGMSDKERADKLKDAYQWGKQLTETVVKAPCQNLVEAV